MASENVSNLRKFVSPEIIFGAGARHSVASYAMALGASKVFVVTDPGVANAGWIFEISNHLSSSNIEYVIFDDVSPNPRTTEVMLGAQSYLENHCDLIVAVGGGSPMDCAKAIGIVATNNKPIIEFKGIDCVERTIPPLLFIPTTAGSSADVSQFSIITNIQDRTKFSIVSKSIVPDIALIDPETTLSLNTELTACTGIDALVHGIEAFVSVGAGPLTDSHALESIKLINLYLEKLVHDPNNIFLREQVMLASMKAGLAFSNAILGAVHAMSHSLGGWLDLQHGLCNALILEHVVDYNYKSAPERFKVIAETMGISTKGLASSQIKQALINKITRLKHDVGITPTLSNFGVHKSDIPFLSDNAMYDPCMVTNPRKPSKRDLEVVYEEAL